MTTDNQTSAALKRYGIGFGAHQKMRNIETNEHTTFAGDPEFYLASDVDAREASRQQGAVAWAVYQIHNGRVSLYALQPSEEIAKGSAEKLGVRLVRIDPLYPHPALPPPALPVDAPGLLEALSVADAVSTHGPLRVLAAFIRADVGSTKERFQRSLIAYVEKLKVDATPPALSEGLTEAERMLIDAIEANGVNGADGMDALTVIGIIRRLDADARRLSNPPTQPGLLEARGILRSVLNGLRTWRVERQRDQLRRAIELLTPAPTQTKGQE